MFVLSLSHQRLAKGAWQNHTPQQHYPSSQVMSSRPRTSARQAVHFGNCRGGTWRTSLEAHARRAEHRKSSSFGGMAGVRWSSSANVVEQTHSTLTHCATLSVRKMSFRRYLRTFSRQEDHHETRSEVYVLWENLEVGRPRRFPHYLRSL